MTPEQERKVLAMAEDWERIGWLMKGVAKIAKWIAYVAGAVTAAAVAFKTLKGG